ncbi:putative cellulase [Lupinus albus]|uniref:cellulase n=1 Tax=Lupinus albus TaxID=3870 RepID=A0A6A4NCU7_LUPAL|nr:putative cellulase [Lupinus albus]
MSSLITFSLILQLLLLNLCLLNQPIFAFTSQDYYEALEKSILFFEGQRSGRLPSNQRVTWRGDSYDVDLVGGYYDAGDNVKFGFPMAFTRTLLAWSMIEFGSSMQKEVENVRNAIRWSIDYLLKAHTITPHTLYVQVSCWLVF